MLQFFNSLWPSPRQEAPPEASKKKGVAATAVPSTPAPLAHGLILSRLLRVESVSEKKSPPQNSNATKAETQFVTSYLVQLEKTLRLEYQEDSASLLTCEEASTHVSLSAYLKTVTLASDALWKRMGGDGDELEKKSYEPIHKHVITTMLKFINETPGAELTLLTHLNDAYDFGSNEHADAMLQKIAHLESQRKMQPVTPVQKNRWRAPSESSQWPQSSSPASERSSFGEDTIESIETATDFAQAMQKCYFDDEKPTTKLMRLFQDKISELCQLPVAISPATKKGIEKHKASKNVIPYLYSVLLAMRFSQDERYAVEAENILCELYQLHEFNVAYAGTNKGSGLEILSNIILPALLLTDELLFTQSVKQFENDDSDALAQACRWPFSWSKSYNNGVRENNIAVLEERCEFVKLAAEELKKILIKNPQNFKLDLSIEEQWLIAKAVADYAETHCTSIGSKETKALSPFHHAIQLLALQRNENEITVLSLLRSHMDISFAEKKGLSFEQSILRKHITMLLPKINNAVNRVQASFTREYGSQNGSVCSTAGAGTPVPAQNGSPSGTEFSNTPGDDATISSDYSIVVHASKSMLYDLHSKDSLTETDAMVVFQLFDIECENVPFKAAEPKAIEAEIKQNRSEMAALFKNAFDTMNSLFLDPKRGAHALRSGWFKQTNRSISAPKGFNTMMEYLAPKPHVPPYAFALYCYYLCKKGGKDGKALPYEQAFIQQHLVSLEEFKDQLNSITVDGKELGDSVAPSNPGSEDAYPLKLIYQELDKIVAALKTETNIEKLAHCAKIFTNSNGVFYHMMSPVNGYGMAITARIENLCKNVQQRQEPVKKV